MLKVNKYIQKHLARMSTQLIYAVLLLYYAYQEPDTPRWAKSTVVGSFTYLLSPFDSIPDLTPFIGFSDDLSVIMFSLVAIACYITKDVRSQAQSRLLNIFPKVDTAIFKVVDDKL